MPSQNFTYFFTADAHRATDRSLAATWTSTSVTSSALLPFAWAGAPQTKR